MEPLESVITGEGHLGTRVSGLGFTFCHLLLAVKGHLGVEERDLPFPETFRCALHSVAFLFKICSHFTLVTSTGLRYLQLQSPLWLTRVRPLLPLEDRWT
jgi:hypothetical protein